MSVAGNVLIIDDDESIRVGCAQALAQEGYRAVVAASGAEGLTRMQEESFDIALLDLRMPGLSGMEVLERLRGDSPHTVVIVITGYATIESAVQAMRQGAYDYLPKPFEPELLLAVVQRAMSHKRLAMENLCLRLVLKERRGPELLIGESPLMVKAKQLIQKVAPTDATVLIVGETGVGKELAARALHHLSTRRDKPFITVDCGALVENLFESELFGHVRGAFTGAVETTVGKLELAHGGTLFLDEIGNISPEMQVKLLRVLQEREFMKVGGTQRITVDVRVIAATNSDLLQEIKAGTFREDLFYRLSVVPLHLPPLRERREDIPLLAQHLLKKLLARRGRPPVEFAEEALRLLEQYDWPGNVRELENTVERALVMAEGSVIQADDLLFYGPVQAPTLTPEPEQPAGGHLAEVERREIVAALERMGWHLTRAAAHLGINRKTLREKIRKYQIAIPATRSA